MSESSTERRKVPRSQIVSWVIDGVLAVAILSAVYQGGQFVERLDTVVTSLEALSDRVSALEARPMGPGAQARIALLEAADANQERMLQSLKADITARLDRIEDKTDSIAEALRR